MRDRFDVVRIESSGPVRSLAVAVLGTTLLVRPATGASFASGQDNLRYTRSVGARCGPDEACAGLRVAGALRVSTNGVEEN